MKSAVSNRSGRSRAARGALLGLAVLLAQPWPAAATDKTTKTGEVSSGPFETVKVESKDAPPLQLIAASANGGTSCDPGDLRVPANTPIDLRVENHADQIVTLGSPDLFAKGHLIRFDGAVAHAESELGFTIKPKSRARIVVRTPAEGTYPFTCALISNQGEPFKGTLTVAASAQ